MKTLPIGPALAYARTVAGAPQDQIGRATHVSDIERGIKVPRVNSLVTMLANANARLVIVTTTGEQVQIVHGVAQ